MIIKKISSLFWQSTEYLVYFFIFAFPFVNYGGFLYTGSLTRAVNLLLLAVFLGVGFSFWLYKNQSQKVLIAKSPVFIALILNLLFMVVSGLVGLNWSNSFWSVISRMTGVWYFSSLGLFMFLLWPILSQKDKFIRILYLIVWSTSLYSIFSLLGPEGLGIFFKGYAYDGFTFGNSTFAGMYIFGAFILSLCLLYRKDVNKKKYLYFLPLSLVINPYIINSKVWFGNFSMGVVGEARSSAYAMLLAVCALSLVWFVSKIKDIKIKKRVSYSLFGFGIFFVGILAYSLLVPGGLLREWYLSQATAARPLVWQSSFESIKDRPLLGYGGDNFERVFESNYDNRLLQDEFGNEAWFDRAHNVFIDKMIDGGLIGLVSYLLVYVVIIYCLLFVSLNSKNIDYRIFSAFLIVYFVLHLVELQTAFDTSISYLFLAIMTVAVAVMYHQTVDEQDKNTFELPPFSKYVLSSVILVYFLGTMFYGLVPFIRSQIVNGQLRAVGSAEKRIPLYTILFQSPIDKHAILWRTSTDFQRGISENPKVLTDPNKVKFFKQEVLIFEKEYKDYILENPQHFRAHLNLADILIYSNLFGVNKLQEAQDVLDKAIKIVPTSPQPYWMKAVGYIYSRNFDLARENAQKAISLNPKIKQSHDIAKYVEDSIQTFPEVNLYFFRQI